MLKKLLFILLFVTTLSLITGCDSEVIEGPQGPAGPAGPAGEDGVDGEDGAAGLSAYDLYVNEFPGYTDDVSQWVVDLATGDLVVTITVVLPDRTEELEFMKGQPFSDFPFTAIYVDDTYETPVTDDYILESVTIYVENPYEDYYGIYGGGHETTGMGGTINYMYTLELKEDFNYEIESYFIMGDEVYDFVETGTYELDLINEKITITPDGGETIEGQLNDDDTITIGVKPSQMAPSRTESTLTFTTTSDYAGVYSVTLSGMVDVDATLFLNHMGEYYYMAVPDSDSDTVYENGTYSVDGTVITFAIEGDPTDTQTGTIEAGEVTADFIVSVMMGIRSEITLVLEQDPV